jgi:SSS family solute:Na+ symporter
VITATGLDFFVIVIYFAAIMLFGMWFSRYTTTTKDFFFGGQRFSWWLIAMSCVATVVGSYSFMKYSAAGFKYGLASSMTYLNDWLILPLFILGWLPIIYFMRVTSIPEYFEKRFDKRTRIAALVMILVYLIGYVGINFYTLGIALAPILGVNLYIVVVVIAIVSAVYMHAGGQTSVIMTDLIQGAVLLIAGFTLLYLGLDYMGGFSAFWDGLPAEHRFPLAKFNTPPKFNFVGIFWQDALASSVAFYFMNQGTLMRFMSAKSPKDAYKAVFAVVIVLMPLASLAIANSGWLGSSMANVGLIPKDTDANEIFLVVASLVTQPGVFGFILAALTAALMSTIDTLITAICAIVVNDIWKPFIAPDREDAYYLKIAKQVAIAAAVVGVLLVPIFAGEKSIYVAHGKFISTVTPAMIVVILMSVFWKRFTPTAAFYSLVFASLITAVSAWYPEIIQPIAHGISPEGGYKFMRAFLGIVSTLSLGIIISIFTKPKSDEDLRGLTIDTMADAKKVFKGGEPNENITGEAFKVSFNTSEKQGLFLPANLVNKLNAKIGDILYISDSRWYLGGLNSVHTKLTGVLEQSDEQILLSQNLIEEGHFISGKTLTVEVLI